MQGKRVITRFRTQKTASLLAYLAFFGDRMHSREVLSELLWPRAASQEARRLSLSVALSSLRNQLEPPEVPAHSLLLADRQSIGLSSLVSTDTSRFESTTQDAERARIRTERDDEKRLLLSALSLYRDKLLPGSYESWIVPQQERLAEQYRLTVRRLSSLYEEDGDLDAAIACAQRAVQSDPSNEDISQELIRLLVKNGEGLSSAPEPGATSSAVKHYRRLEKALRKTGHFPSDTTRALVAPLLKSSPGFSADTPTSTRKPRIRAGGTAVAERQTEQAPMLALATPSPQTRQKSSPEITGFYSPQTTAPEPLPNPLTRFFGRREEIALVERLLDSGGPGNRLITLTGPGGTGKTRIALEIANRRRQDAEDEPEQEQEQDDAPQEERVYFVSLMDAVTADLFVAALRSTLGVRDSKHAEADSLGSLISALQNRRTLLVLDNFEQIVESGAELLLRLMERAPGLTCLVTSRQRLMIPGEREVPVAPFLTVPPSKDIASLVGAGIGDDAELADLLHSQPAVALFVDRAQHARTDFQITRRNAASIAELVYRLEGIPLAIELAAARAQVLTPRQMLEKLDKRLDLLTNYRKVVGGRYQSLREALQLSYDLLSPKLKIFFGEVALFRGGFTMEAAEAVTESPIALDLLAQLCDASLIRSVEQGNGEMRFQILETIREFAGEKQKENEQSSSERHSAEIRHLVYFAKLAESVNNRLIVGVQTEDVDLLEADHDNFRAALRRTLRRPPDAVSASESLRLLASLYNFWLIRGHFSEGSSWSSQYWQRLRTKERPLGIAFNFVLDRALLARAINGAGVLAMNQGDYRTADRSYNHSLRICRRIGDRRGIAGALSNAGSSYFHQGKAAQARAFYERSLKEWRTLGDTGLVARLVGNLGTLAAEQGDYSVARQHFAESLESARRLGNTRAITISLTNLGHTYYKIGNYSAAESSLTESLGIAHRIKDFGRAASALLCLGFVRSARVTLLPDQITATQAEIETGPQFLRIALESYRELNQSLPTYVTAEMERFPAAALRGNGFPFSGLEALKDILERWLPEHAV